MKYKMRRYGCANMVSQFSRFGIVQFFYSLCSAKDVTDLSNSDVSRVSGDGFEL